MKVAAKATPGQLSGLLKANKRRHRISFALIFLALVSWWITLAPAQIGGPAYYAIVHGESMAPALHTGDFVVSLRASHYQIGDVVLYRKYGGAIIHRIVAKTANGNFKTQGLNNAYPDSWVVLPKSILGKWVLTIPHGGEWVPIVAEQPALAGLVAAGIAGISLINFRRPKITSQLKQLLEDSKPSTYRITRGAALGVHSFAFVLLLTVVALVVLLLHHVAFWPRLALAITGVLGVSVAALIYSQYSLDGKAYDEPDRSIIVLGGRLHKVSANRLIEGPVIDVASAVELRDLADTTKLPVLHQVDLEAKTHTFTLITEHGNYRWRWSDDA